MTSYTYQESKFKAKTAYVSHKMDTYIEVSTNADGSKQEVRVSTGAGKYVENGVRKQGVVTSAYMVTTHNHGTYTSESTMIFGNGHCNLLGVESKRITEKAVRDAHAAALAKFSAGEVVQVVLNNLRQAA